MPLQAGDPGAIEWLEARFELRLTGLWSCVRPMFEVLRDHFPGCDCDAPYPVDESTRWMPALLSDDDRPRIR